MQLPHALPRLRQPEFFPFRRCLDLELNPAGGAVGEQPFELLRPVAHGTRRDQPWRVAVEDDIEASLVPKLGSTSRDSD